MRILNIFTKSFLFLLFSLTPVFVFIFKDVSYPLQFTVSNLNNPGPGSLRQAIENAICNDNGQGVLDENLFSKGLIGTIPTDVETEFEINVFSRETMTTDEVTILGPGGDPIAING